MNVAPGLTFTPTAYNTPAYTFAARAFVNSLVGTWRFSVWGRNVINEQCWNSVFRSRDTYFRQPAKAATYGATLLARFKWAV